MLPLGAANALGATVELADVDGDNVDEVVLGGLSQIGNVRDGVPDYIVEVLDDAKRDFVQLVAHTQSADVGSLQPSASGASQYMNNLQIVALDADGDGAKEIMVNQFLFEDLREAPGVLAQIADIPIGDILLEQNGGQYRFEWTTTSFTAGDVNSDRREELIFFAQRQPPSRPDVQVWGIDQIDGWKKIVSYPVVPSNYGNRYRPILLAADLDLDNGSMALEYSAGSHRFVFTEPILIAALAAAPCSTGLGQDLEESCRTSFGQGVSDRRGRRAADRRLGFRAHGGRSRYLSDHVGPRWSAVAARWGAVGS